MREDERMLMRWRGGGGFFAGGRRTARGGVEWIEAESTLGETLRLESPWGSGTPVQVAIDGGSGRNVRPDAAGILSLDIPKGSRATLCVQ